MITKTFSAEHTAFYNDFDSWRKEMAAKGLPRNGVYILRANKSICRLLDVDKEGILYIGKGVILESNHRIGKFINALNNTENAHGGGHRFNLDKIKQEYPLVNADIEITLTEESELFEAEALKKYLDIFGELPPFNRREESL